MKTTLKIAFLLSISLFIVLFSSYLYSDIFGNSEAKFNSVQIDTAENTSSNILFLKAGQPLNISTYEGSGQLTHPSVLYFPKKWNGYYYWAVATPYPNSKDQYENPSIYCFDVPGENWINPKGLVNPIISKPAKGFNSDPCLVYNATSDEIYCFYRSYNYENQETKYLIVKTNNGVSWSDPILLYSITANEPTLVSSMSFFRQSYIKIYTKIYNLTHHNKLSGATNVERSNSIVQIANGTWMMWAQKWDAEHSLIYRVSNDCAHWSEPKNCSFVGDSYDNTVWHLEVKYIPELKRFFMIQYSNNNKCLAFAESEDGIKWKYYPNKILKPDDMSIKNFANSSLYKSSFTYDGVNDTINLWYTGVNTENEWKVGYTKASYSKLQRFINSSTQSTPKINITA